MSTCYRLEGSFTKSQVLSAGNKHGIVERIHGDTSNTKFLLTDGECYLWAYCNEDGTDVDFCRYGANYAAAENILAPIAEELRTGYLSEHDDGFFEDDEVQDEEE